MSKKILIPALLMAALVMTGCAHNGAKDSAAGSNAGGQTGAGGSAYPPPVEIGANDPSRVAGGGFNQPGSGAQQLENLVYFDFDNTQINAAGQAVIAQFARYLIANPSAKTRLEGHADERGTREYNVALGERRANAVQQALTAAGVSPAQLSVISYGEERPADQGHTEDAWAKNRRVEIVRQ